MQELEQRQQPEQLRGAPRRLELPLVQREHHPVRRAEQVRLRFQVRRQQQAVRPRERLPEPEQRREDLEKVSPLRQ